MCTPDVTLSAHFRHTEPFNKNYAKFHFSSFKIVLFSYFSQVTYWFVTTSRPQKIVSRSRKVTPMLKSLSEFLSCRTTVRSAWSAHKLPWLRKSVFRANAFEKFVYLFLLFPCPLGLPKSLRICCSRLQSGPVSWRKINFHTQISALYKKGVRGSGVCCSAIMWSALKSCGLGASNSASSVWVRHF